MLFVNPGIPGEIYQISQYYKDLIADPSWVCEAKADGWRCLTWKRTDGALTTWTKKQKPLALSADVGPSLETIPCESLLDGEWIETEGRLYIWDIPIVTGKRNRDPLDVRFAFLKERLPRVGVVTLVQRFKKDRDALPRALSRGFEGIVLKQQNQPYPEGKTPWWLKVKR